MVEANLVQQENVFNSMLPDEGRWVLFSTILASSMAFIDASALNVALPALQNDLQASGVQLLWIVNAYLLMLAALILVGGSVGDKLGRKKVFMIGISLFMLASLACGFAPTTEFLIGARVMQGIGGAMMIPGSLAIITAYFEPERRGGAIGTWSAATTIVTVAGPVLGGLLADAGLWRGVFLINLPLGLTTLLVLYFKVPESRNEEISGKIDYPGAILITLGLAGLTYGFISIHELGLSDLRIYGSLLGGIVALGAYMVVQARSAHPMMPLHLFKSPTFSGTNLLTLFLYGALSVGTFFLSLNLVQAQGYSQSVAGLADMPFALLLSGLSPWAGQLADRYGPRLPLIVGPSLAGLGFLLMSFVGLTHGSSEYWTTFFPGIMVFGLGMAITVAPLTTAVMGSVGTHYAGTASGINNAVSRTAGVLAIAIVGSVALCTFAGALQDHTANIHLTQTGRIFLQSQANQLGQTSLLTGVAPQNVAAVEKAIKLAFVDTFRVVMIICAGLAWVSALMAALLVESQDSAGKTPHDQESINC
ncbi:MFS transporter [Mastigocladopsis repens]|uniref:MFS transporter n=1 Tax=Mastigocladopsis repens TaxID=221287 RepID=UPI0002F0E072|nr:MFS transporter [Mastigocladopsis repens]